jgi:biotin carboxyl carrier protein
MKFVASWNGTSQTVEIDADDGRYRLTIGSDIYDVDARPIGPATHSLIVDGASYVVDVSEQDGEWLVHVRGERHVIAVEEETRYRLRSGGGTAAWRGGRTLKAPMPGRITHVAVSRGDTVNRGDTLLVIEAMKMENELKAPAPGTVTEVRVEAGQPVNAGDVLVVIG